MVFSRGAYSCSDSPLGYGNFGPFGEYGIFGDFANFQNFGTFGRSFGKFQNHRDYANFGKVFNDPFCPNNPSNPCGPYEPLSDEEIDALDEIYPIVSSVRSHARILEDPSRVFCEIVQNVPGMTVPGSSLKYEEDPYQKDIKMTLLPETLKKLGPPNRRLNVLGTEFRAEVAQFLNPFLDPILGDEFPIVYLSFRDELAISVARYCDPLDIIQIEGYVSLLKKNTKVNDSPVILRVTVEKYKMSVKYIPPFQLGSEYF